MLGIRSVDLLKSILGKFSDSFHKADGTTLYHVEPHKHKLMCYLAVLFLHVTDFKCQSSEIAQELKLAPEE